LGNVLVVGGAVDQNNTLSPEMDEWAGSAAKWEEFSSAEQALPTPRVYPAMGTANGTPVLVGGYTTDGGPGYISLNDMWTYIPDAGWMPRQGPAPGARGAAAMAFPP
jgi:hypothetical protein